ncbi:hypothetical protein [Microbacterium sp. bgisy203]|uniref:hypothetical protein n=1 Tax=Microbacterium sp. bgisy203 TaxID=3413799 RepID=UPI003D708773
MSDAIVDVIRALIENMDGAADDWQSFAMVLDFGDAGFYSTHGYSYSPGGETSAVASRVSAVLPAVEAYLAEKYGPGEELPRSILVQFDRDKGAYEVTFEDKDARRWKVTPANIDTMAETIRPSFG